MYLFYILYVLSGALQTQSSPVTTSDTGNLGNLDKIPFGAPCTAYGYTGVVTFEKAGDSACTFGISAAEGVWRTSIWQFQSYHMDGSDNPWQLAAGKTCCMTVACAAPYDKSFCRNNYKAREDIQAFPFIPTQGFVHVGLAVATDQGNPFIATGKEKLLCPQLGPGNPTSCWMKPTDPIPPGTNPRPGQRHSENTDPGQDAVSQTPSTDSIDSALDTTFSSAFNPQSQPADYTTQEGTTGLSGILHAADQQNQAGYTSFQTASADVPETQATTSQPNELANNDFQMDDLSSLFPGTG